MYAPHKYNIVKLLKYNIVTEHLYDHPEEF